MSAKLRLLKVVVQPFFVLDDCETITEIEHSATVIPAAEWPTYSSERFPREVAEWQARLDASENPIEQL
jgi:mannosyltransferase OCH1-like enzyme